jgi:hypothetical protein
MKLFQEKKDKNMLLTKEERLLDFERQMKRRNKCVYPATLGLTGRVFQTGKLVFANDMKQAQGYIPSIDNLSSNVKDVQSILVLPVYGQRDQSGMPIAIFQFLNKKNFKAIEKHDIVSVMPHCR